MPFNLEQYSGLELLPKMFPRDAREMAVSKFGASLTLAAGTVVGEKTSDSKIYAYVQPNMVQTVAIAGTLSAGGFRLLFIDKDGKEQVTALIAYNASTANIQTAIDAVIPQVESESVVVAGGTAITGTTLTFSGTGYAALPQMLVQVLPDGLTGMTSATVSDTTTYDGTETAVGILKQPVSTDASGNIFFGDSSTGNSINPKQASASVYVAGTFDSADLTGWDDAAAADLGAKTLLGGLVRIP